MQSPSDFKGVFCMCGCETQPGCSRDTINQKFEKNFVKYIKFTLDRREVPSSDQQEFRQMIQKIAPEGDND